jgi:hypothetical protein
MPIPEGRKPLTDADLAALTRRLCDTAIDWKARCEALEAELRAVTAERYRAQKDLERVCRRMKTPTIERK